MQENIRQYNSLLKQVDVMNTQKNQLQEIENTYNGYLDEMYETKRSTIFNMESRKTAIN